MSFVNLVKWTPQSVPSYLGTRLVSFSSILKRKNTATALRIVRLFARWTRKPCARIIRLCYVPRKKIYKCINRLSYDSWSTDFSTAVSFKLISAYALEWIRTKPVYFILSEHIILSLKHALSTYQKKYPHSKRVVWRYMSAMTAYFLVVGAERE